jgi:hypothetical protein
MKLDRVLIHGGLQAGDDLLYHNGTTIVPLKVLRVLKPSNLELGYLDTNTPRQMIRLVQVAGGGDTFKNPREIVTALQQLFGGSIIKTPWTALAVRRNGQSIGTLNDIRERVRLSGGGKPAGAGRKRSREEEDDEAGSEVVGNTGTRSRPRRSTRIAGDGLGAENTTPRRSTRIAGDRLGAENTRPQQEGENTAQQQPGEPTAQQEREENTSDLSSPPPTDHAATPPAEDAAENDDTIE